MASTDDKLQQIVDMYESIGLPRQEALNLALQQYEVGELGKAEELGSSSMEALSADPEVLAQQKATLAKLAEVGEAGLTPEDIAERNKLMREISGQEQGRQKAIQQEMAQRGVSGSGIELASRLASSQASAQRGAEAAEGLEAEKYRRALQGITQAGQFAGQLRGQDFGEGSAKASAADAIAQFNLQNRAKTQAENLARQRQVSDINVQQQQQKEIMEKQFAAQQPAQQFQQKLALTQGKADTLKTQAQIDAQKETAAAAAKAQESAAGLGFLGSAIGTAATMFSDERVKVNIEDGEEYIDEMLDNVEPKKYQYVDGKYGEDGDHVGVMAQDLENSKLGETFVEEDMEGVKRVDYGKMAPTILAAQTKQHEELKDVKSKLAKLEEMLLKYRS